VEVECPCVPRGGRAQWSVGAFQFLFLARAAFRIGALVLGLFVLFIAVIGVVGAFEGGQG